MPIFVSILFALFIVYSICTSVLDKWKYRADCQYPYVKKLMEEWEAVTVRLIESKNLPVPEDLVAGQSHVWNAVAAANALAAACPSIEENDPITAPLFLRQAELEEELETFVQVYNGIAASYNKALNRPVIKQIAPIFRWNPWELLDFNPSNE